MKFTFAIIPAFLALSAFGSPIELDARKLPPECNFKRCFKAVTPRFTRIHACAAALKNLHDIQIAQSMGKPPSKRDQDILVINGGKCLAEATVVRFSPPDICRNLFTPPFICYPE
ncbi:hypothetical protein AGABI1DRAFT_132587 [Agaricus bisporus var. burnettii JB137-S8]|uniref:Hydrophobin n=1 Tax=Agaricus bisporus var. burnettii (strain JB137-S8 / ATCC MYA-4627 / FGSC 10392) TaxID=597362 RepID=K5WIE9_AGABU|nr:uncharacterized protein AGABI1DRAFT_132587 [Agaricus bisporus var. burnettii JB137-S8]EKM75051.1 hypothetical protein AGABI1DRAFT_132587 [Agaricus bisporus var. burnettii JB137-S8]